MIDYLNLVFGSSLQSQQYWNDGLQKSVDKKFSSSYPLWIRERMTQSSRQNGPHVDDISDLTFHETFMECTKNCSPLLRDPRCELLKRILKVCVCVVMWFFVSDRKEYTLYTTIASTATIVVRLIVLLRLFFHWK